MRDRHILALLGLGTALGHPALAEPFGQLRLEYVSAIGCLSREDFAAQIFRRTRFPDALLRANLRVRITYDGSDFSGRLDLVDGRGNLVERELTGSSCAEVTAAIALVAALAIDGSVDASARVGLPITANESVLSAPVSPSNEGAASESQTPAVIPKSRPETSAKPSIVDRPRRNSETPPKSVTTMPKTSLAAETPQRDRTLAIGVVAGAHGAIAPATTPILGLMLSRLAPARVFGSPTFQVQALFGWSPLRQISIGSTAYGTARFHWFASRWLACPVGIQVTRHGTLGACAVFEGGILRGVGRNDTWGTQTSNGWWLAPGAVVVGSAQIRPWRLSVTGGVVAPLIRDRFKFREEPEVFRAPSVGLMTDIELAWAFD